MHHREYQGVKPHGGYVYYTTAEAAGQYPCDCDNIDVNTMADLAEEDERGRRATYADARYDALKDEGRL